jgi:hypothetical protein
MSAGVSRCAKCRGGEKSGRGRRAAVENSIAGDELTGIDLDEIVEMEVCGSDDGFLLNILPARTHMEMHRPLEIH